MEIAALLKTTIYVIASSLLYPVLFFLVLLTFWILVYGGSFFAEWLERIRLPKYKPEDLPRLIGDAGDPGSLPYRSRKYVGRLRSVVEKQAGSMDVEVENLLQETTLTLWRSLDRVRMVIRVGPSLGLIGTLIPMGTGLAALGQGDMTKLSSDLVIAFTTTVIGLAVGTTAYFFYTIKRRWIEEDIKNMELATEILTASHEESDRHLGFGGMNQ